MSDSTWLIKDDKVNPYTFYTEVFAFYLIWAVMYNKVDKLEEKYNLFKRLSSEKHVEARTRVLGTIHAIILTSAASCYYFNYIDYNDWLRFVPISSAFGLFDITILTLNYKLFKKHYFAISIHHLIIVNGPLLITQENSRHILHAYMFETTVPFIDIGWYLYNAKLTNTIFFKINTLFAVLMFFFFRVIGNSYIVYKVYKGDIVITILTLQFLFLNVYWFKSLMDTVLKVKST